MGGGKVVKEGYLIKSPPLNSKGVKRWQRRYFCLLSTKMFEYYKEKPSKGESPKGQLNLEDCRAVNSGLNHNKHKFVFSVELRDRTYYLVAGSEEEMKSWVSTLCDHCGFSTPRGETVGGSATLPAGGSMPFTERFRTVSDGSAVENFYLASAAQKNVRQQIRQDSVEVKAGTSLSEAFSQKGLRGGSFKGRQTSGSLDMSQLRMRSTSITSTDSESSLPDRSPSASIGSGDFVFLRSGGSTPSNSSGLTAGMAQALPPVPTDVLPLQHTDPSNPLYRTPSSLPTNPLYNTPVAPLPSPGAIPMYNTPRAMQDAGNPLYNTPRAMQDAGNPLYNTPRAMQDAGNPMYNTPRAMQDAGNPLYKSPTKSYPPQQQYSSPSSIPANPGPKYNTLPSRGPRSALLGAANSSAPHVPNPGYDTPKTQRAAADSPATRQQADSSQPVDRVSSSGSTKSHRSALLKEISMEDSDPAYSPDEAQLPGTTVRGPVPKPRSDRKLKESIPEEGAVAEDQEEPPLPPVRREIKPAQNADALSVEEPPPPVNRAQKPHFEPPKPPTIDRSTKPLASATAIHDGSSDEEDSEEGEEEFGEVPQKSDDTLHYVKLLHLGSPPPAVPRPVPKPRRNLPAETEPSAQTEPSVDTEYTMVDKQKTAELTRRLSDLAASASISPEQNACVQDAKVVDEPGYVNFTPDGQVDVENDPQYYTVMTSSDAVVPEGHDAYITLIPSGPIGSQFVPMEEEDHYTTVLR